MVDKRKAKAGLLGVGLDNDDGHARMTRGDNFLLVGGSHETHQVMQEKAVKFNEKLQTRGKSLEQLEAAEFHDIAAECGMKVLPPDKK